MHYVPTISRESAEARADVEFVHRVAPTLPEGCLVISKQSLHLECRRGQFLSVLHDRDDGSNPVDRIEEANIREGYLFIGISGTMWSRPWPRTPVL